MAPTSPGAGWCELCWGLCAALIFKKSRHPPRST